MAEIHRLKISPPLMNSSSAFSSDSGDLRALYTSPFTGAVTTRTATLNGFTEDPSIHTVAFSAESISSINSYGYSPHPLSQYLLWVEELVTKSPGDVKPFIISITSSSAVELAEMLGAIQDLRRKLRDHEGDVSRIAVELNTSCPNIKDSAPPSYDPPSLLPLLHVLSEAFKNDRTLTIGLKLPPYVIATQFTQVVSVLAQLTFTVGADLNQEAYNPIAFLTCTNTLGQSVMFASQTTSSVHTSAIESSKPALLTTLGGLAGEDIHALALGNVFSFTTLFAAHADPAVRRIRVIGVGGVTSRAAVKRMHDAGACVCDAFWANGCSRFSAFDR
ncbi:FMN-linked oxidoreductase [Rickenella mellea]|uniref:Dihydroorotate oxidase n=1 Tax=Rickenella mellea TaxID=50990 RepID=A0A4Y7QNV0_9AGAM|nr:FMN-linked oxidoreductase [Rickenella mellea]